MNLKKIFWFLYAWVPVLVCMLIIFYLSSLPGEKVLISKTDWIERNLKNVLHAIQYAILWLLQLRALKLSGVKNKTAFLLTWIITILFALSDEYHQKFTPRRESSLGDIVFDITGMCLAYINVSLFRNKKIAKLLATIGFWG